MMISYAIMIMRDDYGTTCSSTSVESFSLRGPILFSILSRHVTELLLIHHLQLDISFHGSSGTRLLS